MAEAEALQDETTKYEPTRWSEDNLVMFLDGRAWTSLVLDGRPEHICLGKENEVKAVLSGEKPINGTWAYRQAAALTRILQLREETNGADTRAGGLERNRHIRTIRHRPKNTRLSQGRKKIPRGKAHHQSKGLYRR